MSLIRGICPIICLMLLTGCNGYMQGVPEKLASSFCEKKGGLDFISNLFAIGQLVIETNNESRAYCINGDSRLLSTIIFET